MQKRLYKKPKKNSGIGFLLICVLAVGAVAISVALLARMGISEPPLITTEEPTDTLSAPATVFIFVPETSAPETTAETSVAETSVPDTDARVTFTDIPEGSSAEETTTFTSVAEDDGVRRIENFIFYETDTPEYRLARLLYCEIPPVVKTAEVTETATAEESGEPYEATSATTASLETDESGNPTETTVETYTYEIDGVAAVYYKDLIDGETMVFAPSKRIFAASMIKAVYAFALLQIAERGEIDLEEKLIYTENMFVEGSGDFKNIKGGTEFTVRELLSRTIRRSDNTAFSMLQKRYGTAFFAGVMEEYSLPHTRLGAWWRTNVTEYGRFFTVLAEYITCENKYGAWLGENMCESLQSVMLQRALRPEKVAHKYGWDEDSYCDGAVVLGERPYVLVFMSNLDEGHTKAANTEFIYEVGGIIKRLHDEKHAALETTAVSEAE